MGQTAFKAEAKFATFSDAYYVPYLNSPSIAIEKLGLTKSLEKNTISGVFQP